MYQGEPSGAPELDNRGSVVPRARPKSVSLATPSGVTMIFEGATSRWMMPAACAQASAESTWLVKSTAVGTGSAPASNMLRKDWPSTNSITNTVVSPFRTAL